MAQYFPKSFRSSEGNINVEVDPVTQVDTSSLH